MRCVWERASGPSRSRPLSGRSSRRYAPGVSPRSGWRRPRAVSRTWPAPPATWPRTARGAPTWKRPPRPLRAADADRGEEDEHDRRHGQHAVEPDDRDRKVLLGRRGRAHRLRDRAARLPPAEPDREHRPPEDRDDGEDRERDPREHVLVLPDVDDPDDEAGRGKQEVTQDQR